MVEFALISPVFFLMVFGTFEFALLTFDLATSTFGTSEAAKVVSQAGASSPPPLCKDFPGCPPVYGSSTTLTCDSDCQAIVAVNKTALGTTTLVQVDEIGFYKLQSSGNFQRVSPEQSQRYTLKGVAIGTGNYPASGRDTHLQTSDFVEVDIKFTYNPLTAIFKGIVGAPQLTSKYFIRLEPQKY